MKSIGKNLDFIKKNKVRITIEARHLPGGADHNLVCWVCKRQPAVYSMHPNWVFMPCWKCQKKFKGAWTLLDKKWYEFWK